MVETPLSFLKHHLWIRSWLRYYRYKLVKSKAINMYERSSEITMVGRTQFWKLKFQEIKTYFVFVAV